ncbi:antitoxin Xre/MbcA/ParS toxin-binding domain-containing protein [Pseudoalteromonas sp. SK18]|uniref:antitoxin Xre/MbcA/ParS toxin-binding domain-containing protein n=1 Tax=Pseudoalteromonas sp. SK18 TaxID=1938366 RepID=UPI0020CA0891|nr:antitoxin Xre/MbcA/ParS toxin-binding domain-containing protein [Pseudoalteromonas sp. SK18]
MNKPNMNTADTDIDFIKIVTGGKMTYSSNPLCEIKVVSAGIIFRDVNLFRKSLYWNLTFLAKVTGVSVKTIERHKKNNKPFNLSASQNMLELAKLSLVGVAYFGDVNRWNHWLTTPHIQFHNNKPTSVIDTIRGRELIKRIISGLEQGFTA